MFYINDFLESLRNMQLSKRTISNYKSLLHAFKKHFVQFKKLSVKEVSEHEILDYFKLIKKRKITDVYYNRIVSSIKRYFQFLEDSKIIFLNPLRDYALPKYADRLYPTLTQGEIGNILSKIRTDKNICKKGKAIIELCYSSALRPREVYNLKITDIDFKKGLLFIEQSKNRKDRIVPVGKQALYWIKKYIEEVRPRYIKNKSCNYVFISHKTGKKLTTFGIRSAIQRTLELSDLTRIKPYSIRSTAATSLFINGMSIAHISKLLGHAVLKTTQRYVRLKTNELKKVLDKKHPRLKLKNNNGGNNYEL